MPEDSFESLAVKVLAREATDLEKQRLHELFAQDPSLRQHFADLALARTILREVGPLAQALDAAPAPVPEEQMRPLRDAVRAQANGRRVPAPVALSLRDRIWAWAWRGWPQAALTTGAVLLMIGVVLLLPPSRRERVQTPFEGQIIGYLMAQQGQPQIRRRGQTLPVSEMAALRSGDEIRLPARCEAHVLILEGLVQIHGPRTLPVEQVGTSRAGVPLSPRHSAGMSGSNILAGATGIALFCPADTFLGMGLLVTKREASSIRVYSPSGSTRNRTPPLLWKNEPGKTYNLAIIDELNATTKPWRVSGVTSPIDFSTVPEWKDRALSRDGLYRIRLSETDNPLSTTESTFRTLPDATAVSVSPASAPLDKIERAWQALVSDTPCLGDAAAELLTLPPSVANSELPLRLKLVTFGQLGFKHDYDATATKLASAP
jgi:hypothetical protein